MNVFEVLLFITQIVIILILLRVLPKQEEIPNLVRPPASLLRPFTKKPEKNKPKINDDMSAWKIEHDIE